VGLQLVVALVLASILPVSASAQTYSPPAPPPIWYLTTPSGQLASFTVHASQSDFAVAWAAPSTTLTLNCVNNCIGSDTSGRLLSWYQQASTGSPTTRQTVNLREFVPYNQLLTPARSYELVGAWPTKLVESGGKISSVTFSASSIRYSCTGPDHGLCA